MAIKKKRPTVDLHIDRLEVKGGGHISRARLRRSLERELTRRLGAGDLNNGKNPDNTMRNIAELNLEIGPKSGDLGREAARHIHTHLAGDKNER